MIKTRKIATIIGSKDCLNNYLVERLVQQGFVVRLAVTLPSYTKNQKIYGHVGQVVPLFCSIDQENTIARAVEGASVVINLTEAFLGAKKATLEKMNVKAAQTIARISAAAGVKKLLHFSALGADLQSSSPYLVSKKKGEEEVLKVYPSAVIIRSGIVFAPEDQFLNKLALMATYFPIMPVYKVNTRLQPVYAGDIVDAVVKIIQSDEISGEIFDLAGPDIYTNRALITKLIKWLHRKNDISGLFSSLIYGMAFILQFMPGALMTTHLMNMMKYDSIARKDAKGLYFLGIIPTSMKMMAPVYLYCYRPACDFIELQKLQKQAG